METNNLKNCPHGIALELVDRYLSPIDLWDRLSGDMELTDWDKLISAIDPKYEEEREKRECLYEVLKEALPSGEARKALSDCWDQWVSESATKERAVFILGVEAGRRLSNPVCS